MKKHVEQSWKFVIKILFKQKKWKCVDKYEDGKSNFDEKKDLIIREATCSSSNNMFGKKINKE